MRCREVAAIYQLMLRRSGCTVRFDSQPRLLLSDAPPCPPPALGQVYAPSSLCWSFWVSVVWLPLPLLSNAWTGLLFRWWLRLLRNLRCGSPFRTFWYSYFGGPFLCSAHSWHFDCVLSQIHVLRHGVLYLMLYLLSSCLWIYSLMVQNCRVLVWFRDHPITGSALSHSQRSWE